ncbi:hypothetical protein PRIPAC_89068 [Pristionchus pacificus]|uniref:Peptidase n=1 Tax=Pristionchus pacificus TaxID=54126 RepID=A0A2A6B8V5_PRIPA|nr:hypothetical protein PRIPAC_89068 [Pristionchus pacificus]|eukprot:PDM62301.1 Peptidase [Pristionchus pacificus]
MSLTLLVFLLLLSLAGYSSLVDADEAVHSTAPDLPNFTAPNSTDPDEDLPVYLRGKNWGQEGDLRLWNDVVPTNYELEFHVNVRGHAGADVSDFTETLAGLARKLLGVPSGSHTLESLSAGNTDGVDHLVLGEDLVDEDLQTLLNPLDLVGDGPSVELDLHNVGLLVAFLQDHKNAERETIIVHANRTIDDQEKLLLRISYTGMARIDEYGLYENWDPKFNKSMESGGPFILASRNFPTGARSWFPCCDEMDKKATFEIHVNHPDSLSVYSNANADTVTSPNQDQSPFHISFLGKTFLGKNTVIRPAMYAHLMVRHDIRYFWRDLHRFFFREAAHEVNHRVDLLSELVLMYGKIIDREYPGETLYEDYLKELRSFVTRNPLSAASMSTEMCFSRVIEMSSLLNIE